jgi:hypothetical protein
MLRRVASKWKVKNNFMKGTVHIPCKDQCQYLDKFGHLNSRWFMRSAVQSALCVPSYSVLHNRQFSGAHVSACIRTTRCLPHGLVCICRNGLGTINSMTSRRINIMSFIRMLLFIHILQWRATCPAVAYSLAYFLILDENKQKEAHEIILLCVCPNVSRQRLSEYVPTRTNT